jgi:transcriptional regulator with XRE-family HTH domain
MKKENTIRSLLGVTQLELAMLLGVSRSQCAMFETGQRDLPLHAQQLLAEMLTYLQSTEATAKSIQFAPPQATQPQLERLLRENEYQQLLTARKISTATKKIQKQDRLLQLTAFLSSRDTSKTSAIPFPAALTSKTRKATETPLLEILTEQHMKQEILELEKLLLESRLLRMRSTLEFTENK